MWETSQADSRVESRPIARHTTQMETAVRRRKVNLICARSRSLGESRAVAWSTDLGSIRGVVGAWCMYNAAICWLGTKGTRIIESSVRSQDTIDRSTIAFLSTGPHSQGFMSNIRHQYATHVSHQTAHQTVMLHAKCHTLMQSSSPYMGWRHNKFGF